MPRPQSNDVHIEFTYNENKYTVGQKVNRFGATYTITRIEYDKKEKGWHVYGQVK